MGMSGFVLFVQEGDNSWQCSRKRVQQLKKRKKSCFLKSEKKNKKYVFSNTYSWDIQDGHGTIKLLKAMT